MSMRTNREHVLIDHSAFIGQFSISDEILRETAKGKLSPLGSREESEWIAVETFEENSYTDDTLWGLPNEVQDEFFPFMDRFHSLLKTEREPLQQHDAELSLQLAREFDCHFSNALTCAVAIRRGIGRIVSFYDDFRDAKLQGYLREHRISVDNAEAALPSTYPTGLEGLYERALKCFQEQGIDLTEFPHR